VPAARVVLAIDPGRGKCGVAVCAPGAVLARAVTSPEALPALIEEWQRRFSVTEIVIGNRTGGEAVRDAVRRAAGRPIGLVDEAGTTLRARARYFAEHPPRGWRRFVPRGLLTPPEPYDDYAAVLLAEAALAQEAQERE
jgi:RNase H-fold protein (predicted Holliday junction resolvase)